jgi:ABC-type glycerol-3-phosphate transport system substrate-binding protein
MMRRYRGLVIALITLLLLSACNFEAPPALPTAPPAAGGPTLTAELPGVASAIPDTTSTAGAAEQVTITFGLDNDERPLYEPLVASFEQQNPTIHVQLVVLDPFLAGSGQPSTKQIMTLADTARDYFVEPEDLARGWLRDLKPLMDADPTFDRADFYPGALESVTREGRTYLLPSRLDIPLLFYNKDLWTTKGLKTPAPDWTWRELRAAMEQLATKRGETIAGYGLLDWFASAALIGELSTDGVDLGPAADVHLDDPKVVAAFAHVVDLIRSGAVLAESSPSAPTTPDLGHPDAQLTALIQNQQIGIWAPHFCCYEPSTLNPTFDVGTLPLPAALFPYFSGVHGYVISGGSQHPEAAWRWIAFLSQQDGLAPHRQSAGTSSVPARRSVVARTGFWQQLDVDNAAALQAVLARPGGGHFAVASWPAVLRFEADAILRAGVRGTQPVQAALRNAERARQQQVAQQPPPTTPSPEQLVVATPVPPPPAGVTTINFATPPYALEETRRLASRFNQQHPDSFVAVEAIDAQSGPPSLAELASQADCFVRFRPPTSQELTVTLDLQPLIDAEPSFSLDDYPPALLAPFRHGSGLYGLPDAVLFRLLHYNMSAFDAAHLAPPTSTWTIEDFLSAAQQLTRGTGAAKQYGFAATGDATREVLYFLDRLNAPATASSDDTLRPNFTHPRVVQALQAYLQLLRTASPNMRLQGYRAGDVQDTTSALIRNGQVGMWLDFGTNFLDSGPGEQPGFAWAIAAPPLDHDTLTANDFVVRAFMISAQTRHPELCWTWITYLSTHIVQLFGAFPARTSLATSTEFANQATPGAVEVDKAYRAALARTSGSDPALEPRERLSMNYYWFFRAVDRTLQGGELGRELAAAQALTEQYLACVHTGTKASTCVTQVDPDYQGFVER